MKLAKSLLLGSATAFVAVAGANAADLPSKKAAPTTYVKVCDAYGAGFYTIPGTDTCVRIYGRVRTDHTYVNAQDIYATNVAAATSGSNVVGGPAYMGLVNTPVTASSSGFGYVTGASYTLGQTYAASLGSAGALPAGWVAANGISKKATNNYGFEARAVLSFDARTPTAYGTVQSVAQLQMKRTTGVGAELTTTSAGNTKGMGPQLEAAYIRFAGFTFGAARDNFAFMPSVFYGSSHWASFANGAKQIAYTAALGGGLTATVALQDNADTTAGGVAAIGTVASASAFNISNKNVDVTAGSGYLFAPTIADAASSANGTLYGANYKSLPQVNGRIDFEQKWGTISAMGAVSRVGAVNGAATYDKSKTAWAVGAGAKINLPMIAAGDTLWLNGGVAEGMTEYTINYTSFKSSSAARDVGGYVLNHPSWLITSTGIETLKSWNVAGQFQHFWSPNWRQNVVGTYGSVSGTTTSKSLAWGQSGAFGDAKVWNTGTQLAFLPTKDFEIGVEVLYARVSQDVLRMSGATVNGASTTVYANSPTNGATSSSTTTATVAQSSSVTVARVRESLGNWTGRLRIERNF